jgi:cytochrome c2
VARTNRPDEAYHIPTLNFWFAISGIVLLITSGWMVWDDYARDWKNTQRDFRSLERARLTIEKQLTEQALSKDKIEELKGKIKAAEDKLLAARNDVTAQKLHIERLEQHDHYTAKQAYNFAKAELGDLRYQAEEFAKHHPDAKEEIAKKLKHYDCEAYRIEGAMDPGGCPPLANGKSLKALYLDQDDTLLEAQKKYGDLIGEHKSAEAELDAQKSALAKVQGRIDKIATGFFNDNFRDAPLVDFLAPSLKIEQAVIKEIRDDYNFATVQKEDRCMTCHQGIDKGEFQVSAKSGRFVKEPTRRAAESPVTSRLASFIDSRLPAASRAEVKEAIDDFSKDPEMTLASWLEENIEDEMLRKSFMEQAAGDLEELRVRTQTYKAHPQLELFMTSASPHPMDRVGCTVCHEGRGHATDFNRVFHTPQTKEQEALWAAKYGWHEAHYWDYPQLPVGRVTSSCAKCHGGEVKVASGGSYNRGKAIVEANGCFGCHRIEGITGEVRKVGPALQRLPSKLDKDFAYAWIWNPRDFRPSSKMPRFFNQSNNSSEEALALTKQEVRAVVSYIWTKADEHKLAPIPAGRGDAAHGKQLVREVGCLGCHSIDADKLTMNTHGPDLSGVGSKLSAQFIYNWITNPKGYFPNTHMPSLRLSQQEALDITEYLSGWKKDGWKTPAMPERDTKLQAALLNDALSTSMRRGELTAMLEKMTDDQREVLLGEKTIQKYGCTGCHEVKGLENAGPIGTELSVWADKFVTQLDFGLVEAHGPHREIDYNHISWATWKLKNPRVWDGGKEDTKLFSELLKMPNFEFTDQEAFDVVTFLMSRKRQEIHVSRQPAKTAEYLAVQAGRRVVRQYNCHGCHYFDGEGGNFGRYWEVDSAGKAQFNASRGALADFNYLEHVPGPVRGHVPPVLIDQGDKTRPEWLFEFLAGPVRLRPKLKMRMPSFQFSDDNANKILKMFAGIEKHGIGEQSSYEPSPSLAVLGRELFERGKCERCHAFADTDPAVVADGVVAPNLKLAAHRLQPNWIPSWLRDPQSIMPGANMPNYFDFESKFTSLDVDHKLLDGDLEKGMRAIRDYLILSGKTYRGAQTASR